jgi:hypothetical protein
VEPHDALLQRIEPRLERRHPAVAGPHLVKNDVQQQFGHACTGEKPATVTGSVTEKDRRKWLAATKVDEQK